MTEATEGEQVQQLKEGLDLITEGVEKVHYTLELTKRATPTEDIVETDDAELGRRALSGELRHPARPAEDDAFEETLKFTPEELEEVPGFSTFRDEVAVAMKRVLTALNQECEGLNPAIASRRRQGIASSAERVLADLRSDVADWAMESLYIAMLGHRLYQWVGESAENAAFFEKNVYQSQDRPCRQEALRDIGHSMGLTDEECDLLANLADGATGVVLGDWARPGDA